MTEIPHTGLWRSRILRLVLSDHWMMERTLAAEVGVHGVLAVAYGAWVLLHVPSLSTPAYRALVELMPENVWGALFLTVGLFGLLTIELNRYGLRRLALAMTTGCWLLLGFSAIVSAFPTPAWIVQCSAAMSAAWAYIKLEPSHRGAGA